MTELQRIMHVEDDPSIQQVAKIALEAVGGFTVHTCSSGTQALADYADFAPQLILLDVMMGGLPASYWNIDETTANSRLRQLFQTIVRMPEFQLM